MFESFLPSTFVQQLLVTSTLSAELLANVFINLIAILLILGFALCILGRARRLQFALPATLTSLGILGTFAGIVIGLLAFDTANIDQSIGGLLAGLKTAFLTSLVGMAAAITLKLVQAIYPQPSAGDHESVTIGDRIVASLEANHATLERIEGGISDSSDASLATQFKGLRTEMADRHVGLRSVLTEVKDFSQASAGSGAELVNCANRQLKAINTVESAIKELDTRFDRQMQAQGEKLKGFAVAFDSKMNEIKEQLARSPTEQVIEALRAVIQDFNQQLTEQFGDNFKALDASVGKLVRWQELYKAQLQEMAEKYQIGVTAIGETRIALSHISDTAAAIPESMKHLETVIATSQHQLADLERHLGAFEDIKHRAVEAVPVIRAQVERTVQDIASATKIASEQQIESAQKLQIGSEEMVRILAVGAQEVEERTRQISSGLVDASDIVAQSNQSIQERLETIIKQVDTARDKVHSVLETAHEKALRQVESAADAHRAVVESSIHDTSEARKSMLSALDGLTSDTTERLRRLTAEHTDALEAGLKHMRNHIEGATTAAQEGLTANVDKLDQSMQTEIQRVIVELGNDLAKVTGQFTDDYVKLTTAMNDVVGRYKDVA